MKKLKDVKVGDVITIDNHNFLVSASQSIGKPTGSPYEHWLIDFTDGGSIVAPGGLTVEYPSKVNK